jgi:hypothetical protein
MDAGESRNGFEFEFCDLFVICHLVLEFICNLDFVIWISPHVL